MPRKPETKIESVFSKHLAFKARELAAAGTIRIIETGDFPEGAPIHEDGSTEYDPRKPLVLLAVWLTSQKAILAWNAVLRDFDRMMKGGING